MDDIDLGIDGMGSGELIGRGGFADVYAATDQRLARRVAVKVMRSGLSPTARRRFDRECIIMGKLSSHPNVVTVHAAGYTDDGRAYLVMELVADGTLADRVERAGPMPWERAVAYMLPILDALQAAHAADVLHRDVKPDNILLAEDQPRLSDFGIAQLHVVDRDATDELNATWEHTPPETLDDARDERSDVYSAASTLYTLIAGRSPYWDHHDRKLMSMIHRLLHDPIPVLSDAQAPPAVSEVLTTAMAKDPADRYASAEEFALALRQAVADSTAQPAEPWYRRWGPQVARPALTVAAIVVVGLFLGTGLGGGGLFGLGGSEAVRGSQSDPYPVGQSVTLFYEDTALGSEQQWSVRVLDDATPGRVDVVVTYRGGVETAPLTDVALTPTHADGDRAADGGWCDDAPDPVGDDTRLTVGESIETSYCWDPAADGITTIGVELRGAEGVAFLALS